MDPELQEVVSAIRNACFLVRHYRRGRMQQEQRRVAIEHLGLLVRRAFNLSDDFEPILAALVDGLCAKPEESPF